MMIKGNAKHTNLLNRSYSSDFYFFFGEKLPEVAKQMYSSTYMVRGINRLDWTMKYLIRNRPCRRV